jgi:hypothetical protein
MHRTEVYSKTFGGIASCEWTPQNLGLGVTGTYREANARLIASAPDLLAALKECAAVCAGETINKNGLIRALEMSRAAITKATGVQP